jgi:hypothetical protein
MGEVQGEERGAKGRLAVFALHVSPCTSPFALSLRSSPSLRNLFLEGGPDGGSGSG